MLRAIVELLLTIAVITVARAVLMGIVRGVSSASAGAAGNAPKAEQFRSKVAGELHRDPVCGTFVAESTQFQHHIGRQTYFYCSAKCLERHASQR